LAVLLLRRLRGRRQGRKGEGGVGGADLEDSLPQGPRNLRER